MTEAQKQLTISALDRLTQYDWEEFVFTSGVTEFTSHEYLLVTDIAGARRIEGRQGRLDRKKFPRIHLNVYIVSGSWNPGEIRLIHLSSASDAFPTYIIRGGTNADHQ